MTQTLDMSSWAQSAGYADETIVATTPYKNTQAGGEVAGTFDLYGYQIPVDPTRTLVSVSVPNNRNVVIMALGFGTNNQVVVPGTYVYNPAAGALLPVGTDPLSVAFTPTNTAGYTGASATNSIVVTKATPIINWPTPAAISVGTALSGTQLDATATFQGAPLAGTYTYTVLPANTPAIECGTRCRHMDLAGGLCAHGHHGLHQCDGNGSDRGRHHRLHRRQRRARVPQRRLLLL